MDKRDICSKPQLTRVFTTCKRGVANTLEDRRNRRNTIRGGTIMFVVLLWIAGANSIAHEQQQAVDLVRSNGKRITVDEGFTIAQAVAIQAGRIIAVASN